jgi:OTU-like cysteine protease
VFESSQQSTRIHSHLCSFVCHSHTRCLSSIVMGKGKKKAKERASDAQSRKANNRAEKARIRRERNKLKGKGNKWKTTWKEFETQLSSIGLRLRNIKPDGNCLFRSLADQMEGNQEHHMQYRQMICDFMEACPEDFSPFVEDDFEGVSFPLVSALCGVCVCLWSVSVSVCVCVCVSVSVSVSVCVSVSVSVPVCAALTLSPSHPLTLSPSHPLTLSPSHPLTLSPSHPLTLSPSHLYSTLQTCVKVPNGVATWN